MRTKFTPIIAVALLAGCATSPDPIDSIVATDPASHGDYWQDGKYPIFGQPVTDSLLPQTASQEEVIKRSLELQGFDKEQVASCKILKIRQTNIPGSIPGLYILAHVRMKIGEKIILIKYEGPGSGWWSRICDVKTSTS